MVEILLVEDGPGDVRLLQEAFSDFEHRFNMHVVGDGEEALQFLRHEGSFVEAPRPNLILLDLNLPRLDGRELLRIIKVDEALRCIPVVVLTTSCSDDDVRAVYDLTGNAYIVKADDYDAFFQLATATAQFWLDVARLPLVDTGHRPNDVNDREHRPPNL